MRVSGHGNVADLKLPVGIVYIQVFKKAVVSFTVDELLTGFSVLEPGIHRLRNTIVRAVWSMETAGDFEWWTHSTEDVLDPVPHEAAVTDQPPLSITEQIRQFMASYSPGDQMPESEDDADDVEVDDDAEAILSPYQIQLMEPEGPADPDVVPDEADPPETRPRKAARASDRKPATPTAPPPADESVEAPE